MDLELARHYKDVYFTFTIGAQPANPIIDKLLPALFLLRVVSILDDAMAERIAVHNVPGPTAVRNTFHSRIEALVKAGVITGAHDLKRLRERRNEVAHDPQHSVKWGDVDHAAEVVHRALRELTFAADRPRYEFYAVREAPEPSNVPGILMTQRCYYGLKQEGQKAVEVAWTTEYHDESASGDTRG